MSELLLRLKTIADMITVGSTTADIGADHALLSLYLIENKISPKVIIGELNDGPYQRAKKTVQNSNYSNFIDVRKGDGLKVLGLEEVETVVIAGMGGDTIVQILEDDLFKSNSFKQYILQPMTKPEVVRKTLCSNGFRILDEKIVQENNNLYLIMKIITGYKPYKLSDIELEIGPIILKDYITNKKYIKMYKDKFISIYNSLDKSSSSNKNELIESYLIKIKKLEAVLNDN